MTALIKGLVNNRDRNTALYRVLRPPVFTIQSMWIQDELSTRATAVFAMLTEDRTVELRRVPVSLVEQLNPFGSLVFEVVRTPPPRVGLIKSWTPYLFNRVSRPNFPRLTSERFREAGELLSELSDSLPMFRGGVAAMAYIRAEMASRKAHFDKKHDERLKLEAESTKVNARPR